MISARARVSSPLLPPAIHARFGQITGVTPEFKLGNHVMGQHPQGVFLFGPQCPGFLVQDAQCAKGATVRRDQRHPGVKADSGWAGHHRIVLEPVVFARIWNQKEPVLHDGMGAEGDFTGGFGRRHADPGFEPLAVFVHQRNERDGRLANMRRQVGEIVKHFLGNRVEHVVLPQDFEASGLVLWNRNIHRHSFHEPARGTPPQQPQLSGDFQEPVSNRFA